VDFVFLCARNNGAVNISVRSEAPRWNAAFIVQEVLKGLVFGGGHSDTAGLEGKPKAAGRDFFRLVTL
jgi:hypothetical protein